VSVMRLNRDRFTDCKSQACIEGACLAPKTHTTSSELTGRGRGYSKNTTTAVVSSWRRRRWLPAGRLRRSWYDIS
jgi:hypothetical protein